MKLQEIQAKSILTKSGLSDTDFVINSYTGCAHNCIYCYATFMKRFTNHKEPWGEFLDVKINACDLIPKGTDKYRNKKVFLSSVTDPYQPAEKKYELMRCILKKLIPFDIDLTILTKSDLVLRDIDLIKKLKNVKVGVSLSLTDDKIRKEVEPYACSVERRISAVKELRKAGISNYIFVSPILSGLSDVKKIIEKTKDFTDEYWFENLNVKPANWFKIKKWLTEKHPQLLKKYQGIYFTKNSYWNKKGGEIRDFCKKNNKICKIYFHHAASLRFR